MRSRSRHIPVTAGSHRSATMELGGFHVIEAWFPPHLRLAPHHHDRGSLAVMLDGSFDLEFRRRTYDCPPRSIMTEPVGERHANRIGRAGAHVLVLQPDPAGPDLGRGCASLLESESRFRHPEISRLARRVIGEMRRPDDASPLVIEGAILEMLGTAARSRLHARGTGPAPRWLDRVEEILHQRFRESLTMAEIAEAAGVHVVHVARVFRARHGVSIGRYVRHLRIEWSADQLLSSDLPLGQIASEAGFSDQSHFTRWFRELIGTTPGTYRRAHHGTG